MSTVFDRLKNQTISDREALFSVSLIQNALKGAISREQYIAFLGQAYHHVKHTVPLLMACGSRLGRQYHWLQAAIAEYIEEEIGHEQWILADLRACGADAEAVEATVPLHETEMMVAYAYHLIDRVDPIGFLGMVNVLEGTSVAIATHAAQAIQRSLDLPEKAFSYLNSHGSLDLEHVQFFEHLVNRISDPEGERQVISSAKRFYRLYGDIFRALPQQ